MQQRRTKTAVVEAARLVLPVECAGCGAWDVPLCPPCARLMRRRPVRCEQATTFLTGAGGTPALPTWSVGPYRGALRALVLGWKTGRRQDLAPEVLAAARDVARVWCVDPDLRALLEGVPEVVVMPAPSGWRRRLAGRLVVADLADAVARGLAAGWRSAVPAPSSVLVADLLRRHGGRAHQSGRGARDRGANRRGTVRVRADLRGASVLVVDDVVTTGATLAACAEAIGARGGHAVAALTLCSTPAPGLLPGAEGRTGSVGQLPFATDRY